MNENFKWFHSNAESKMILSRDELGIASMSLMGSIVLYPLCRTFDGIDFLNALTSLSHLSDFHDAIID